MINQKKQRVVFYLDKKDILLLNNQCELLQIKASFFIRNSVLEKLDKPVFEVKKLNLDIKNYSIQLMKIGTNLNQIARQLNSGNKFLIKDQQLVLSDIQNLNNHIMEINSKLF
jgi:hypothetical protein